MFLLLADAMAGSPKKYRNKNNGDIMKTIMEIYYNVNQSEIVILILSQSEWGRE